MPLDPNLRQFATDRQWEYMEALEKYGSGGKAADVLGVNKSQINRARQVVLAKAARQGYAPEHDMTRMVPDGFHLRGTSTLYNADGEQKLQWVKTSIDHERQLELMREAIQAMADALPRLEPVPAPEHTSEDLLAGFPIGDHHTGMLSWAPETGQDYDLAIAERLLTGAMQYLIDTVQPCDQAIVAFLGDFVHQDGYAPVTPTSKNQLDSDTRFPKIIRATIRMMRYCIDAALRRHKTVRVIVQPGNHDPTTSIFLTECLSGIYENEPRASIDNSPSHYHYFAFGRNLIGVTHGDKAKLQDLPLIMATDRPEDWGRTSHRFWWTGHVHHDRAKDVQGCKVESFRVLPPPDAWAAKEGHRSKQDMKALILHREYGEIARHTVNPGMLQ